MKLITLLALLPFFALTFPAHADPAYPPEDASLLPWDRFTTNEVAPYADVKLLATLHIGSRLGSFQVPLSNCGNAVESVEFKVEGANVTVQTFGVRFTDGTTRDFTVNKTYNAGTDSGWIDLGLFRAMDSRCLAGIYARAQASGLATVQVYGKMK